MPFAMTTDLSLIGKSVAVTRPRHGCAALTEALREAGAEVLHWPVFAIELTDESAQPLRDATTQAQWIVFTSANAVDSFVRLATEETMRRCRIASIGPSTTDALGAYGVRPEVVASPHTAEGIVETMRNATDIGSKTTVLYPHAEDARAVITNGLSAIDVRVISVVTYRKVPLRDTIAVDSPPDVVTFASGSAVRHLDELVAPKDALTRLKQHTIAACIGPATADVATELAYQNILSAETHTSGGVVAALIAHFKQRKEEA